MDFQFIGTCKHCGSDTVFVISPDAQEEYKYAVRCPRCGIMASTQDVERFYHLTDALQTLIERNNIINIKAILI